VCLFGHGRRRRPETPDYAALRRLSGCTAAFSAESRLNSCNDVVEAIASAAGLELWISVDLAVLAAIYSETERYTQAFAPPFFSQVRSFAMEVASMTDFSGERGLRQTLKPH
jgi:hypothetical protein